MLENYGSSVVSILSCDIEDFFESGDISLEDFAYDEEEVTTDDCSTVTQKIPSSVVSRDSSLNLKRKRRSRKAAKKRWTAKPKKKSVWYVQPLTDEPGSLLYFPHSLAYFCNCGDMDGLADLVKKHFHKKALIHITGADSLVINATKYLSFLSLVDVLFSDLLSCVYHTRVVGNQILSRLYYSYTDAAEMYKHTDSIVTDLSFRKLFVGSRSDILRRRLKLSTRELEVQEALTPLIGSKDDLQMYYRADIVITFDEYTHKVLRMDYEYKIKAVGHNGERYRL